MEKKLKYVIAGICVGGYFAYEYYQANILEDFSISMEEIFDNEFNDFNNYKIYRTDIINKAKEYFLKY